MKNNTLIAVRKIRYIPTNPDRNQFLTQFNCLEQTSGHCGMVFVSFNL
jgi:hypothetical protein